MRTALEAQVLDALARGPLTANELVRELEVGHSTVRAAVWSLRTAGLVAVAESRRRGWMNGSGRPAAVYALVADTAVGA